MNSITQVSTCAKIDSNNILDPREKLYFNEILQQELFSMDCASDGASATSGRHQAFLQGQALLGNIMVLAEQS